MEKRLVSLLGTSAKHILGALLRTVRAVAITGLVTALVVLIGTEGIAYVLNRQFPPTGTTHLVALALAVAFAYAAAITVFIEELLRAIIKTIELIVEESEKLAVAAVKEGELLLHEGSEEALKLGRGALGEAGTLGRGAIGAAETIGRDVGGVVGGISGAVGHEVRAVESHIPGHHNATAGTSAPVAGSSDAGSQR